MKGGLRRLGGWTSATLLALATAAGAGEGGADVEAEIKALRAEVAELRAQEEGAWLNERRAEEIKGLIHEVLADAETRASMQDGGLLAGWNKSFFLASEDGNFLLRISGQSQTRYIWNSAEHDGGSPEGAIDEGEGGFQQRRTKLTFDGHIFDPKFKYEVTGAFSRGSDNRFELEVARFEYEFADGLTVTAGTYKVPFLIEELMSSKRFQAVERSFVNDYFTLDYTQGAHVTWTRDALKVMLGIHDGSYARGTEFNADSTHLGLSGRVEYLLFGDAKQFGDYQAWSDTKPGLVIGGGIDWEQGESGGGSGVLANGNFPDVLKWTADVRAKFSPVNVFAAYVGQQVEDNGLGAGSNAISDATQHGFVIQAGVFVIPDKLDVFARYEFLDFDGAFYGAGNGTSSGTGLVGSASAAARDILADSDELSIVTVGVNYYFARHDLKLTFDVLWFCDPMPVSNTGAGMVQSSEADQFAIRGQFQFLF